MGINCLMVS
jgi:hypothetical protein